MELYTFINKLTGDPIRFVHEETGDSEFGELFYFSDFGLYPVWFATKKESIDFLLLKKSLNKNIHPLYSQFPETPDFDKVDLNNYELKIITI